MGGRTFLLGPPWITCRTSFAPSHSASVTLHQRVRRFPQLRLCSCASAALDMVRQTRHARAAATPIPSFTSVQFPSHRGVHTPSVPKRVRPQIQSEDQNGTANPAISTATISNSHFGKPPALLCTSRRQSLPPSDPFWPLPPPCPGSRYRPMLQTLRRQRRNRSRLRRPLRRPLRQRHSFLRLRRGNQ